MNEEIRDFLDCGSGSLGRDRQVSCYAFGVRDFDTRSYLLRWLPSSRLVDYCGFVLRLLRP
jgi:hypothetical protein